ncbi:hypothetical protein [Edaphobacter modestus]|uniref:Uncharacterized protein n=1 Tax=Edaphobacter modestus TaxID=388466 RepID=A0A4Q7XXQ1_9BACT|nr:hypothetical protein [Edaphobacter modestus]RZU29090.1 hypothetical protein BDD14_6686 [Edaphobacter modestus]
MKLSEARIKAKEIYGETGYAVLRGANKKLCVIGFVDRTGSRLGINVDLASAASFEEAFLAAPPSTAVYFLKRTAEIQTEFLAAAAALEATLGFKIDRRKDLRNLTVEDLRNRQKAPEEIRI